MPTTEPNSPDAIPARKLWVELETRILSQKLHYRSGDEVAAAKSVGTLFKTIRQLLVDHPQAADFEALAVPLLNQVLRPYTARWHGWMTQDRFAEERTRRTFRKELIELRQRLLPFRDQLRRLCPPEPTSPAIQEFVQKASGGLEAARADLGGPIRLGIRDQVGIDPQMVAAINQAEWNEIRARRELLGRSYNDGKKQDTEHEGYNATGLALSGGGIRSATFCLGIVQVLARRGLFSQFDYLSTVSGGGYFGSFLSCYLGTAREAVAAPPDGATSQPPPPTRGDVEARVKDAFGERGERESDAARHLRNNSKYLLNGGFWGRLKIIGLLVSGVLFNLLMLLPIPLGAALIAAGLGHGKFWGGWELGNQVWFDTNSWSMAILIRVALLAAFFVITLPLCAAITKGDPPFSRGAKMRSFWEWMALLSSALAAACALVAALPVLLDGYVAVYQSLRRNWGGFSWDQIAVVLSGASAVLLGPASVNIKKWAWLKNALMGLFLVSGPLFFLMIFLFVTTRLMPQFEIIQFPHWKVGGVALVFVILVLWGWFFVDLNTLAPHRFYRARLCECFLAMRGRDHSKKPQPGVAQDPEAIGTLQRLPLSSLGTTKAAPYHLINCTVNLPSSEERNLRGRNGDFFLFSRHYCGSPIVGYARTEDIEKKDRHLDLGTAMAISGAAASSNMGIKSMPAFRFLITLMNIRLGYWLQLPNAKKVPWILEGVGPWYLFRELAGKMHEHCRYLNLSDGGHIENLAAYELLRRRCKFIVCVDGGADPSMGCEDLLTLQRYAYIDLGVRIELDLADLKPNAAGLARAHSVLAKVIYSQEGQPLEVGWLLYLKLAVTGGEPDYARDYRRAHAAFPHQTTGDQLFEEDQFESYRVLGETAMRNLLRSELLEDQPLEGIRLDQWFQCLADKLLPDNDPAFSPQSKRS